MVLIYTMAFVILFSLMERTYSHLIEEHLKSYRQIVMLSGPRQVGKTTLARSLRGGKNKYLTWDAFEDRERILKGPEHVAEYIGLDQLRDTNPLVIFDELHKYSKWKSFLKAFFDKYEGRVHIIVTGSAKMDIYTRGGDSLMGRYFPFRLHPLSVAELLHNVSTDDDIHPPSEITNADFENLLQFGGFPEPFLKNEPRFHRRWKRLRNVQLFREDIRELTRVQELQQLELFAHLLVEQASQLIKYSKLANKVRVSVDTIRRWFITLESLYFCFRIRPWTPNIARSLLKEPKVFLWDWSQCTDVGARNENFIASHLLKAVHFWTDVGLGDYDLHFIRDKEKREVDFLVSKDGEPFFLVEVKSSTNTNLSKSLLHFAKKLNVKHVFQVGIDGSYVDQNIFELESARIVPAKTFLSQLV